MFNFLSQAYATIYNDFGTETAFLQWTKVINSSGTVIPSGNGQEHENSHLNQFFLAMARPLCISIRNQHCADGQSIVHRAEERHFVAPLFMNNLM